MAETDIQSISPAVAGFWDFTQASTPAAFFTVDRSITADGSNAQGGRPLTCHINVVEVSTIGGSCVTLPPAAVGRWCCVVNHTAATLNVFPASGDRLWWDLAANQALAIAQMSYNTYWAVDDERWLASPSGWAFSSSD